MARMTHKPNLHLILGILFVFTQNVRGEQADAENCFLCHDLTSFILMENPNTLRNFEVTSTSYQHSTHRNVICRDCHTDINQFPHPEAVQKVDCAKACHVTKPFALTGYSHTDQRDAHAISAHGANLNYSKEKNDSKPGCKYCHDNSFRNIIEDEVLTASSEHCMRCHEGSGLAGVILHVSSHSAHRSASASIKVVELCSSCHADESRMQNFDVNLTQVGGYQNHFSWQSSEAWHG